MRYVQLLPDDLKAPRPDDCVDIRRSWHQTKKQLGAGSYGSVSQVCKTSGRVNPDTGAIEPDCDYVLKVIKFDPKGYQDPIISPAQELSFYREVFFLTKLTIDDPEYFSDAVGVAQALPLASRSLEAKTPIRRASPAKRVTPIRVAPSVTQIKIVPQIYDAWICGLSGYIVTERFGATLKIYMKFIADKIMPVARTAQPSLRPTGIILSAINFI